MIRRLAAVALAAFATAAVADPKPRFEIRPGRAEISPEEAALAGVDTGEHAIVLVSETIRKDLTSVEADVHHHFRAKILTAEGRDLANVAIPGVEGYTRLAAWWARVILPDGRVLEVPKEDVQTQPVATAGAFRLVELRASLPGVVPGAILDYGWRLRTVPLDAVRVELQGPYRVLSLRLGWCPRELPWLARISRAEGRQVTSEQDVNGVWITARDLPAVVEEPLMPPLAEVRTAVHLFYSDPDAAGKGDYWSAIARSSESWVRAFNKPAVLRDAIRKAGVLEDEPLDAKLRRVYTWLETHVRRSDLLSSEELDAAADEDADATDKAREVLDAGVGTARQLDWLFLGMARELGAQARLVYVADRRQNYFDPGLRSMDQFAGTVVAVGAPGVPLEGWTLVDAGSGLPYGEVPWRFSGIGAFVATGESAAVVRVPPSRAEANVTTTNGNVRFLERNEAIAATWSRTAVGQAALEPRRDLRGAGAERRRELLRTACGAKDGLDVLVAESPGLEKSSGSFELRCEAETEGGLPTPDAPRYVRSAEGPWLPEFPVLPAGTRIHPVVFRFPLVDEIQIVVEAPEGFIPGTAPPPVSIASRFGEYTRIVSRADRSFEVMRRFRFTALAIPPAEYGAIRAFLGDVRAADRAELPFVRDGDAR